MAIMWLMLSHIGAAMGGAGMTIIILAPRDLSPGWNVYSISVVFLGIAGSLLASIGWNKWKKYGE